MEYNFREIEQKWQEHWGREKTFRAVNDSDKPKYYVLDMFPYPSGAGLHVGHPLGYIASDIYSRYKRHKGFNVLHPMGYDAFGLPAEQYAIQTGQHPAVTTENNIKRYREQLDKIGFSFDWEREVRTSDPDYYKWTQWIFIQFFNSWYNKKADKAEPIETLTGIFEKEGNSNVDAACSDTKTFSAGEWKSYSEEEKQKILLNYRLAYLSDTWVNWCPQLGTVLANEEVKDGVSERGGYPVERKLMRQWFMRITAYAERLLSGLDEIDWSESIKEQQRNWIGKSEGTSLKFEIQNPKFEIEVFTTRPDTIFGVTFITLAPEHELVEKITTDEYRTAVGNYITEAKNRSERERMADVKRISGQFTGAYAKHPFSGEDIPVWIGDYVLAGYGTGAVMAVPGHDTRDYAFAKHFKLPIKEVVQGGNLAEEAYEAKEGKIINSDFLNGLEVKEAIKKAIDKIEEKGLGKRRINYRLRDAIFSRQRYWGEPFPVYYKNEVPHVMPDEELPLVLPEVDAYLPTETGEPPLARAKEWIYNPTSTPDCHSGPDPESQKRDSRFRGNDIQDGKDLEGASPFEGSRRDVFPLETNTMPGWAGSSWYFLRYMDAKNDKAFASREAINYWENVDLYIGGSEHATGHLLYSRFWNKFLFDMGYIPKQEPFKKLINQGMIQGQSMIARIIHANFNSTEEKFVEYVANPKSFEKLPQAMHFINEKNESAPGEVLTYIIPANFPKVIDHEPSDRIPIEFVRFRDGNYILEAEKLEELKKIYPKFKTWRIARKEDLEKICSSFKIVFPAETFEKVNPNEVILTPEVEKMSKSKYNVVNPDDIIEEYGADTLRLYEMFLGPLEQSKPWNTNGIEGVHRFLKKLWRLFHNEKNEFNLSGEPATKAELKTLHKTIKKVQEDIERFSFNTSVSTFMICVNELTDLKCNRREVLEQLTVLLSPYAPHIAEELWQKAGHKESIAYAGFPVFNEKYVEEDSFTYPVSFNGKTRLQMSLSLNLTPAEIEKEVLASADVQKYLAGSAPKKVIVVPKKIVNIVV